jgi:hypothetical protein
MITGCTPYARDGRILGLVNTFDVGALQHGPVAPTRVFPWRQLHCAADVERQVADALAKSSAATWPRRVFLAREFAAGPCSGVHERLDLVQSGRGQRAHLRAEAPGIGRHSRAGCVAIGSVATVDELVIAQALGVALPPWVAGWLLGSRWQMRDVVMSVRQACSR